MTPTTLRPPVQAPGVGEALERFFENEERRGPAPAGSPRMVDRLLLFLALEGFKVVRAESYE